ncbi:MAG: hypothetical protein NXI32_29585 [bacterium]|nr:hypothetical protein [bacterium]
MGIDVHIRKEALVTKRGRPAAYCCLVSPERGLIRGGRPCLFKLDQTVLTNVMISRMVVRPCLSVSAAVLLAFTTLHDFAVGQKRSARTALLYARECEKHLGPLPQFRFEDAVEIPTYRNGKRVVVTEANLWSSLTKGDIPAAFGDPFQLGNRVGRYQGKKKDGSPNPDVVFVSFYRDGGLGVIGHNMKTGATCFLSVEEGTDVRGDVPTPDMPGYEKAWQPPSVVAEDGCVKCHMADPFLHTPWIDQVRVKDAPDETLVPLIADADSPYFVIGEEFPAPPGRKPGDPHATIPKHLQGNKCVECHAPQCVPEFFNVKLDELKMSAPFHSLEKETRERWIKDRDEVRAYCRSLNIRYFEKKSDGD